MIISFSIGNFRSFREVQTFNLAATNKKPRYSFQNDSVVPIVGGISGLKVKVAYGANGSGKSNLLMGLATFVTICKKSISEKKILKKVVPFLLDGESQDKPTFFELEFDHEEVVYRYGFEVDQEKFHSEWLFARSGAEENMYFEREGNDVIFNDEVFPEGEKINQSLNPKIDALDKDDLFLSLGVIRKSNVLTSVMAGISKITVVGGVIDEHIRDLAQDALKDPQARKLTLKFLRQIGIKVDSIIHPEHEDDQELLKEAKADIGELGESKIIFAHAYFNKKSKQKEFYGWPVKEMESAGTQRLVLLAPFIISAILKGEVLVIDEFEARLHTTLSRAIIEMFIEPDSNPNHAQLIVATHDTNLLSSNLLRRDQVAFVQRNEEGASEIFSLSDIKYVRNDASHEKDYLSGLYEAVPNIERLIVSE
ncbi:ATP-binding protein [Neolewinella lacunae]|uniref:ATP-binding protein n=1 Tax=Neolewinella lacunae TaxID=1517758 RepID=A0A923T6U7_9BACT|nr:ATP-binding protein [Neolewinella lacunae]MBC6993790.1 ATP-binding protein [Neolewinella lacunae]MDN3635319.1 ATP-binding protein [Neolewinella lacunae]